MHAYTALQLLIFGILFTVKTSWPHMAHSHAVHLPLGALLIRCTGCGHTGEDDQADRHRLPPRHRRVHPAANAVATAPLRQAGDCHCNYNGNCNCNCNGNCNCVRRWCTSMATPRRSPRR